MTKSDGKLIPFKSKKQKKLDQNAIDLVRVSDELDAVILKHLTSGKVDPRDVAGVLSHRLGTLMRHIDNKDALWEVCEKVLKKQAAIDEAK